MAALDRDVRYGEDLFRYTMTDLNALLNRVFGIGAEDLETELPGAYVPEYDARYLLMDTRGFPLMTVRAARLLPDGTVLAAWQESFRAESYGLARLVKTSSGWHLLSNRVLYREDFFGG